jgi:hypothetical protein
VTKSAFPWQVGGFGNFSGLGESNMILRNTTTGGLQVCDINNNQITNSASRTNVVRNLYWTQRIVPLSYTKLTILPKSCGPLSQLNVNRTEMHRTC